MGKLQIYVTNLKRALLFIANFTIIMITANYVYFQNFIKTWIPLYVLAAIFININIVPSFYNKRRLLSKKLINSANGNLLLKLFLSTTAFSIIIETVIACWMMFISKNIGQYKWLLINNAVLVYIFEFILFWNGIIRIYLTSTQLRLELRILGLVCGMIPVIHLLVLAKLIETVDAEVIIENHKIKINNERKDRQICKTKYPVLMVHGIFFRDFRYFNYWGRIPGELERNGAAVYYGSHQSAASVEYCAGELKEKIMQILKETGAEKVNVIAHSKGGLDMRYAISKCGAAPYVASLTTINTPHRGCEFADYLLEKVSVKNQQLIAKTYNTLLKKFGDTKPDFMAGVRDLTKSASIKFNEEVIDSPDVYYQSFGSRLNFPSGGHFPLNFSYDLVKAFDGYNDGLVGEESFPWGQSFKLITTSGVRGISHGDMIDMNRENFDAFDVREFFVQVVSDLREKGF